MSLFQKFPEFQKFEKKSNNHFLNSPKNEDKIGRGLRGCNETHFPKATRALPCPGPTWELTALIRPSTALDHSVHQPPLKTSPHHLVFLAKLPLNQQTVQVPPFRQFSLYIG